MKKLLIILSFVLVITQSCDDYLDVVPDNVSTIDNAFSNEYEASKYLATCYSYLPNFGSVHDNPAFFCGDEAWLPEATLVVKTVNAWKIARGAQGTTKPILNFWSGENGGTDMFDAIRHCNTFIERIPSVLGLEEYKVERWQAEVKFLKAYYIYWLVRNYGPIPLMKENIPVYSDDGSIFQERQKIDDCFEYIVNLIDESLNNLPLTITNEGDEFGRITQPAALAIKAKILTTAASPLFNGNTEFESLLNSEGEPFFSAYDANKWVEANNAIDSAISILAQTDHELFTIDDYTTVKDLSDTLKLECALRSIVTEKYNKEVLWASSKSYRSDIQDRSFPRLKKYWNELVTSNLAPTLRVAEQFYTNNGVPINEDNGWDYENRYKLKIGDNDHRYRIKEGEKTAILHFNREPRFYSTLAFDRGIWFGAGKEKPEEGLNYVKTRVGEPANKENSTDYSITGYWAKKLVHIKSTPSSDNKSFTKKRYAFPIIRVADLYLLKAEVANEIADVPTDEVFEYVDKIRTRAGLKGVKESWTNYSNNPEKFKTKAGMRNIIQQERMIELCMEGQRFWDLRRWKKSHIYFNKTIKGWNLLGKEAEEFYQPKVLFSQFFSTKDYFWPIQEYRIVENPKLIQNKGW
jgi:hypothetical protein